MALLLKVQVGTSMPSYLHHHLHGARWTFEGLGALALQRHVGFMVERLSVYQVSIDLDKDGRPCPH